MSAPAAAFVFKPFSTKQKKLLTWWTERSPYRDYDLIVADGSIRSGKTIAMIDSFITWSLYAFESETFIIAGKSMGALKRNVLKPMFQILAAKNIPYFYNRSEHFIQIGGNTYYCFGANNEASQDVLQGLTAAGAYADEVALFPQSFVDQMIGRCSVDGSKVFMNCNPGGPYHWFKLEFIDKAKEKHILHLHFTMDDNLSLSEKVKARFRRMFSGVFFKRYILGLWVLAEGVIYDMFRDEIHIVDELPEMFERYWICSDYGTANPCVFLLVGEHEGKYYVIREYYYNSREVGTQKTDGEYSRDLQKFIGNLIPQIIIVDPSAASFIAQLRKDGIGPVHAADNEVLPGIANVAQALSNGILFIHRSCINLIREFGSYVWDEKAQQRGEDKPVKQFDHALDALRYLMRHLLGKPPIIMEAAQTSYEDILDGDYYGSDVI